MSTFKVKEIDSFAQRAILSFRGYLDLYTTTLIRKPIDIPEPKNRKNQTQYTWTEENIRISHLLISIGKRKIPSITPFFDSKFKFEKYKNCFGLIQQISSRVGLNWWELGLHLGVAETRLQSIRLHYNNKGVNKMAEHMLLFWLKGCETYENKYDLLKNALKNCNRTDIIDRIDKPKETTLIFGC